MPRKQLSNYQAALKALKVLADNGHKAYLVGGCVRDMLLQRQSDEHDIATDAVPQRICQLFSKTRKVGVSFGVVLVAIGGHWIEVATFRAEGPYIDGRHPEKVSFTDAREDAFRRDFTINGMFYDPVTEDLIDHVDGQKDLHAKLIKAIGDPQRRFAEDHLRMLRAARFAAALGFKIEDRTAEAIKSQAAKISAISAERIGEELAKILALPSRSAGIKLICDLNLLVQIIPELACLAEQAVSSWAQTGPLNKDQLPPNAFCETLAVLDNLPSKPALPLSMAALLHLVGLTRSRQIQAQLPVRNRLNGGKLNSSAKLANSICKSLALSNDNRRQALYLIQYLPTIRQPDKLQAADIKRWMIYDRFGALNDLYASRVEAGLEDRTPYEQMRQQVLKIDPAELQAGPLINGNDLQELNIPVGPTYQQILDQVYDMQLNEQIHTRRQALAAAGQIAKKIGLPDR